MSISALIVGYGSIGQRHYRILSNLLGKDQIQVVSKQNDLPLNSIKDIMEASQLNHDYVVIASETQKHYEDLKCIINNANAKKILVEKPLFETFYDFDAKDKSIFVGYNLRFHPLIIKLRDLIQRKEIKAVYCSCHSFLPDWREERHFLQSYSASSAKGGGVILDLSHEIDILLWLFGNVEIDFVKYGKFSDLNIKSEDSMFLSGHLDNGSPVELSLSYFSMVDKRQIHIVTNDATYIVDLIENVLISKGEFSQITIDNLTSFNINDTYTEQHTSILEDKNNITATLNEGLNVNSFIDQIKLWKDR